jgi:iron complex outermembrane receptor protein
LFYNDYDQLASLELGTPFADADGRIVVPIINQNLTRGRSQGAELLVEWQPTDYWRLTANYSGIDLELRSEGLDLNRGVWFDGATPRGQAGLRSLLTLGPFELDAQFRHLSRLRRLPVDPTGAGIDAYAELDLRFGWRPAANWQLSLVGQNLLDDGHFEFGSADTRGALERAVYLKAEWRQK